MKLSPEQVKEQALSHYDRMIAWAESKKESPARKNWYFRDIMQEEIGEAPTGRHCVLCRAYYIGHIDCAFCPVNKKSGQHSCESTPYGKIIKADIKGDFQAYRAALKEERDFLASLDYGIEDVEIDRIDDD